MTIASGRDLTRSFEGCNLKAKPDDKGKWVIGVGHDIPAPEDPDNPPVWTQQQADDQFNKIDYPAASSHACQVVGPGIWTTLNEQRQSALTDFAFQMGMSGLSEFVKMLGHVRAREWDGAAAELLNSEEAKQTPVRAQTNAAILKTGVWPKIA